MEDHFRESHTATSQDVPNSIYNMTPEEEEALLLEYGVSNVITDELLPQIAAPSTFQSEYGTRDVFLTAETSNAHANEDEERSISCSSDDDDDNGDGYCSNVNRHNKRWRNAAKICELTRNDVFTNSPQRLLMKYTSSYSYLTSETLLQATEFAVHDLQEQHKRKEQENSTKNLQSASSIETQANNKFCHNEENRWSLENNNRDDSNHNSNNDDGDDEEVNDDIVRETNQLLREADNLINKTSQHNQEEEEHKQQEEVNSTNYIDANLFELAYKALWANESEILYDEECKEQIEMMECNSHSRENDNECVTDDKEVEELLADARKHIAQLRTIQKTCADDMTNTLNEIKTDETVAVICEENEVIDDNDEYRKKSSNEVRDKSIMENVNINSDNKEEKVMPCEAILEKEQQEQHEREEFEVKDLNVQITKAAETTSYNTSNKYHDNNTTFYNEDIAEVEITNDCNTKWDVMHTEWENAYRIRQSNFHSVCSAQRIRTACYVDPVHLGESIQCNIIDGKQEESKKVSLQLTDSDSTHEINSQVDKSHFDVERHKHLSIMKSVHRILEESKKEYLNNNDNDDKTVDHYYNNPADSLQLSENEIIARAMSEEASEKATLVKSKESASKHESPERRRDAEGYAILPLFVERVDELLEPSRYEYAPESASSIQTSSSWEQEHRCYEQEQSEKVESPIKLINQNTQLDFADKIKSSIAVKNLSEKNKGNNAAVNVHAAEYKNMLKRQLHASRQHMREKWRVEHELTEYHQLCKEDDEAQMRELRFAIELAECEEKLNECHEDECNSRLQLIEQENSMREELYASALMHKQLIINVMRAKQEEKLKLLISYLAHEQNTEYTLIIHQEYECWQTLLMFQQKQYNELYEAEVLQRRIEEERRRQEAEEVERVYWLPENVCSRALTQCKEIMENWFNMQSSQIQNSLDAIAYEMAIREKEKRKVQNNKSVVKINISPSSEQYATITFADSEDITNKKSEEEQQLEESLNSHKLINKLKQIVLENNKLDKLSLSQLTRYAYKLSFSSSHINLVDNTSLQNCHVKLSWSNEETKFNLHDENSNTSNNCNSKVIYATLVRDVDLSENTLEKLQLAVFLRSFPALQVLNLNKNNLSTLSANLIDVDDNNYKSNKSNSGNRSLRSVKAVYDNAISEQTRLHTLDISHNKLNNVDEIATLLPRTLTRLHAHDNALTSIAPLVTCTRLQELNLAHNAIHSLDGLHTLRLLRYIDISYNMNYNDDQKTSNNYNNNNNSEDEKLYDLSPICNNCLLLEKLCISHNHIRVLCVNGTTHCSFHETRERPEEDLEKQQEHKQYQEQRTKEILTYQSHRQRKEEEEQKENAHSINHVKPNVFIFMTELHIDHNELISLSVENMPYLPMLTVLHAEHNAITDISGLMHCPRLMYVDLSHNALATWKDLRPIMYCEQLTLINLLCNPCLRSASENNEHTLCNKQSTSECCTKHTTKMRNENSKNATCCTENSVEELLVQWLPKLQKLNNMHINNNNNHVNNSNVITDSVSKLSVEQTTDHNFKLCKNNNDEMLTLDKSICEVRELWELFHKTHASRMLAVQKWETEWRQEAIKRNIVNYISPDPAYVHQLKEIANMQEFTFLQYSLQHYLYRFQHQEDKATELWSKLTEFVHKNSRLLEQEQIAHVTLCKWLQKYISVWRAKKLLIQLREEMKIKEQEAKWISALCVLQPVGRGAMLRMRLRHVLSTRIDTKQQSNSMLMQHHLLNGNASRSGYKENSAAFDHDDDDKLYVKINEELPQLLQSISCTSDTGIVNLLRKVNVKQVPVPMLPLLQTPSLSSESSLLPQSASNASKSTSIDLCNLLPSAQTQKEALKLNEKEKQLFTQNVQEQTSVLLDKNEGSSDESAYSAIVSAQMAKKRKKMNRQHEQVMKDEFIHDPLKVKKMRQKDQTM